MKKYTNKKIYYNMGECLKKVVINLILVFIISVIFMLITLHLFFLYHNTKKKFHQKILFSALYYRNNILI